MQRTNWINLCQKRLFHLCSKRLRFRYHEDLFEGSGADTGFREGVMVNY